MTTIATQSATATAITLGVSDLPANTDLVEVQYSSRRDFMWDLAPLPRFAAGATIEMRGLNSAGRYFFRARAVLSTGVEATWSPIVSGFTAAGAARQTGPAAVMVEEAIIVIPEPVVAWTAPLARPGYPAAALGRDDPISTMWLGRSNGIYVIEVIASGSPIDTIALLETNLSEAATWVVKAGPTLEDVRSAAPAFATVPRQFRASPLLPQRRGYHGFMRLGQAVSQPVWRIEITADLPGDLLVATYGVLGRARVLKNMANEKSDLGTDMGTISRGREGIPNRVDGWRGRTVDFELVNMTEQLFEEKLFDLPRLVGATDPVLVVPNSKPGAFLHDRILFGQLVPGRATNTTSPRFNMQLQVQSLI